MDVATQKKSKIVHPRCFKDCLQVTHPTDWVNSLVIVEKPDKSLRICIDPHDLNKAIKRPHHPMPTFDEAIQKHEGAKFFTKLDARHGYWSLVLDEESSELTTFATPFGRFKFRRMPFGLISTQDEFQRRMEEAFEGVPGFSVIVDNIIISGKSETEHDVNTRAALTRARERTVKLNKAKCILKSKSIPYFGHVISKDGIHPDPNKVNALKEMPRPRNREELQTLLGMLNYLSRYIPNLSSQNEPLQTLSKQHKFVWEEVHDNAFDTIKKSICSTISPFNPSVGNLELQVDASKSGLGAVLIQNENIISFSSRSLNTTEQKYSQIEKELYAIVFGIRHFHQYLYGHSFVVVTDHKPLATLINQPMQKSSPHLQRMLLQIQPYDLTVIFRPGKEIPVPDILSRLYLQSQDESLQKEIESYVHSVMSLTPISPARLLQLKKETLLDPILAFPKSEFVESHLECQLRQQKYYNRHSKDLQELKQGQSVEAQIQGKSWEPAVMLHKHKLPRSYIVQTQDMKAYHQNRKYLRMSPDDTDLEQYQHTNSNGVLQLSSTSSPSAYSTPSKSPPQLSLFKPQGQAQKSVAKFRTKYRHPP
ncbi:hypothetical protein QYM36_001561 [Artemia franciscana]|uniref:Uncharacterized protein n=1 Tax=Artemia franciscana TaxID=6661 RepID=A0AA88IAZ3_ARTSF|nr:hypothetical protein QYM36_001561 [Artemia franciscana]